MRRAARCCVLLVTLGAMASARADTPNNEALTCRPDQPSLDKYGYLRALSLDLRGTIPTPDELAALDAAADVPLTLLDKWLASDEFVAQAVRRHRDLLWNNVRAADLLNFQVILSTSGSIYYQRARSRMLRGDYLVCEDAPARIVDGVIQVGVDANGYRREGWVMVEPYWAPGTQIKVCAFDAQAARVSSKGTDCATRDAFADPECGCGPGMRWCATSQVYADIRAAIAADVERRVGELVKNDRPYTELFNGRTAYVNGPMVHLYRHLAALSGANSLLPLPVDVDRLPDLPYPNKEMVAFELGAQHAGVLTSPAYLLRFQTYRARANRFFDAFLCQPFQPPPGGLPSPDDACSQEPDLQNRCGCKYCHSLLEPSGVHWGRWTPGGGGYLDPVRYPKVRADCLECARTGRQCSADCRANYVTRALSDREKPYLGMLQAYYFRRAEHEVNVEQGPTYLALTSVVDNRLPACTARRSAEWLLGRDLLDGEKAWAARLGESFVGAQYSYRGLVRAIVTSPNYRRVR